MSSIAVRLGPHVFKTKKAASSFVSNYLKSKHEYTVVSDVDLTWVMPLLQRHARADEKLRGYKRIVVDANRPQMCFYIEYDDNRVRDAISYTKCITPQELESERTKRERVNALFRFLIEPQIKAFRTMSFRQSATQPCALCHKHLERCDMHVDHNADEKLFSELTHDFLALKKQRYSDVDIVREPTHEFAFVDKNFEDSWVKYHEEHARLRLLCKACNLGRGKKRHSESFLD